MDELRGYEKPYSSTAKSFENTEKEIESVVSAVTKDYKTSAKFFALKKKVLGLKDMEYSDKNVSVGTIKKKFTFAESVKILKKAFSNLDPKFERIFEGMLDGGQVSVFPKRGKSGGAFCIGDVNVPTYVLLNHTDDFSSLTTFAHEMGHAFHTELSKEQDIWYQAYPISTAEVASTFFEKVLRDEVIKDLSDKEKVILLHDQIDDQVSTIHRQVAAFNFELELHNKIRKDGFQSKEEIGKLLQSHMRKYLGNAVKVPDSFLNFFVYWGHFRRYFYVYSYAYGCLVSNALYAMYKENPESKDKIIKFLSLGGSMSPREIFAKLGINTESEEMYKKGLSVIRGEINQLEKLLSKK